MRRRTVQPEIRSFVSVLRSPVTPFDRSDEECELFRRARVQRTSIYVQRKCELSAIQEGSPRKRCKFLARKVQNSSPILRCTFWQGKVQNSSPISALLRWRHFRLTLSLSLSLSLSPPPPSLSLFFSSSSLSLTERTSRTIERLGESGAWGSDRTPVSPVRTKPDEPQKRLGDRVVNERAMVVIANTTIARKNVQLVRWPSGKAWVVQARQSARSPDSALAESGVGCHT